MNADEIYKEFIEAEALLKGHFILSSGLHSDTYLQCARVLMEATRAERLCRALADKIIDRFGEDAFDIIVSPAMGGVVVGYEMGRQMKLPAIFCERQHGEFTLRRGFRLEPGQRVLLVEDVVTTGKSSLETVTCVEQAGGTVLAEACLIDRSGGRHGMPFPLVPLMELWVPTYQEDEVPQALKVIPAVKPGSRWLGTGGESAA